MHTYTLAECAAISKRKVWRKFFVAGRGIYHGGAEGTAEERRGVKGAVQLRSVLVGKGRHGVECKSYKYAWVAQVAVCGYLGRASDKRLIMSNLPRLRRPGSRRTGNVGHPRVNADKSSAPSGQNRENTNFHGFRCTSPVATTRGPSGAKCRAGHRPEGAPDSHGWSDAQHRATRGSMSSRLRVPRRGRGAHASRHVLR